MLRQDALPSHWDEIFGQYSEVTSVMVPGYVDLDAHPEQVKLFPLTVALGDERGYLKFGIDKATSQLTVDSSSDIELPEELMDEPSIRPLFVDLGAEYLGDALPVEIVSAALYLDQHSNISAGRLRGIRIDLRGGEELTLDPFWTPGIRIGGKSLAGRLEDQVVGIGGGIVLELNRP